MTDRQNVRKSSDETYNYSQGPVVSVKMLTLVVEGGGCGKGGRKGGGDIISMTSFNVSKLESKNISVKYFFKE